MVALILRLCVVMLMTMLGAAAWPALASASLDPMLVPHAPEVVSQKQPHARRPSHADSPDQLGHLPRSDIPDGQRSALQPSAQITPGHGTALSAAALAGRSITLTAHPINAWAPQSTGTDCRGRRTLPDPTAIPRRISSSSPPPAPRWGRHAAPARSRSFATGSS